MKPNEKKEIAEIAILAILLLAVLLLASCTTLERKTESLVCIGWCWHIDGESKGTTNPDLPKPKLQMTRELLP